MRGDPGGDVEVGQDGVVVDDHHDLAVLRHIHYVVVDVGQVGGVGPGHGQAAAAVGVLRLEEPLESGPEVEVGDDEALAVRRDAQVAVARTLPRLGRHEQVLA